MEIRFANSRIRKICTNDKAAIKELGRVGVEILTGRLEQIRAAQNLEELRYAIGHWQELFGRANSP
jgi:hypothetical protein